MNLSQIKGANPAAPVSPVEPLPPSTQNIDPPGNWPDPPVAQSVVTISDAARALLDADNQPQ